MTPTSRRLFLAGAFALACAVPSAGQADGVLRVGTVVNNEPWEFTDPQGRLAGFDIDLMMEIGRRLGMRVEFDIMPFRDLFGALERGQIEAAICSITVTPERASRFDFSQPFYRTSQGVVVMRGSGIRSLHELKGRSIGVEPGTTNEEWVKANARTFGFGAISYSTGVNEGLRQLQAGEIAAYFGDLPVLIYQLLKRRDLAVIERLPTQDLYAVMLPKGSPLTEKIDLAIAALKKDGRMADIHRKWFGQPPEPGSPSAVPMRRP